MTEIQILEYCAESYIPCFILADTTSISNNHAAERLNKCIKVLEMFFKNNRYNETCLCFDVCLIEFGSTISVGCFERGSRFIAPEIKTEENVRARLLDAVRICMLKLQERKKLFRLTATISKIPWVILITDGWFGNDADKISEMLTIIYESQKTCLLSVVVTDDRVIEKIDFLLPHFTKGKYADKDIHVMSFGDFCNEVEELYDRVINRYWDLPPRDLEQEDSQGFVLPSLPITEHIFDSPEKTK